MNYTVCSYVQYYSAFEMLNVNKMEHWGSSRVPKNKIPFKIISQIISQYANNVKLTLNICKDSVLWSNLRVLFVCLQYVNNETKHGSFKLFLENILKILWNFDLVISDSRGNVTDCVCTC